MFDVIKVRIFTGEFIETHCSEPTREDAQSIADAKNDGDESPFFWLVRNAAKHKSN